MLGGNRLDRVSELLRHEVSQLLHEEIEREPGVLATVTRVEVSPDLEHANVYVSILPDDRFQDFFDTLNRSVGHIQQLLNKRLVLEFVPKLRFLPDRTPGQAAAIERLLDTLDDLR